MKRMDLNPEKNRELRADRDRNICFEDIVAAVESGGLLDDVEHPNIEKYPGQRLLVVALNDYVYAVPYVETADGIFLKTAFPESEAESSLHAFAKTAGGALPMTMDPKVGRFLNAEEAELIETFEKGAAPLVGALTTERRTEIEAMARSTMADERTKISLRVPKRDLTKLKSRALQEGVPYQTLINALIRRYVSG